MKTKRLAKIIQKRSSIICIHKTWVNTATAKDLASTSKWRRVIRRCSFDFTITQAHILFLFFLFPKCILIIVFETAIHYSEDILRHFHEVFLRSQSMSSMEMTYWLRRERRASKEGKPHCSRSMCYCFQVPLQETKKEPCKFIHQDNESVNWNW